MSNTKTLVEYAYSKPFVIFINICRISIGFKGAFFLLFLLFLFGCDTQGTGPVIKTVYIEEIDPLQTGLTEEIIVERSESSQADGGLNTSSNEIDSAIERIEQTEEIFEQAKTDSVGSRRVETDKEVKLALAPAIAPPKMDDKFEVDPSTNSTLQLQIPTDSKDERTKLEKVALEAAFEMLARRAEPSQTTPKSQTGEKEKNGKMLETSTFKIGLLVPLTGPFSHLGNTISAGSELAFFKMRNAEIELLYFDTSGGKNAVEAANDAISNNVDVVIGPLFSESVSAVKPLLKASNIPILSFSNNIDVAEQGVWVLGYLPEQQISQLVDFAVARGKQNFGILSSNSQLGNKITNAAINQLEEYGLSARTVSKLTNISQMEQDELLRQIKIFTKYVDTSKDQLTLPPPAFDTVIIAGDTDFILQVAPILSYYDLGPDRALFVGIDKWNKPKLLNEPSLQNALLTLPKRPAEEKFRKVWQAEFTFESNDLAKIAFDATALVIATAKINSSTPLSDELISQPGFIGFSGQFKMSKSGLTERIFEIKEISDNLLVKPSIQ